VISPTERNTTRTPCPGDCAPSLASRDGEPAGAPSRMRDKDCSARTCRMPACTEPEERLTESANGSVASWRCCGPEQVSRGACPDDSNLTESGNPVVVPALETLAAVALFGLEEKMATAAEGLKSSGLWQPGGGWPVTATATLREASRVPATGSQLSALAGRWELILTVRSPGRAGAWVGCDSPAPSERRRAMAGDNPRPPRRP